MTNLWTPNSPDLNPVDYKIWGHLQDWVYQKAFVCSIVKLKQRLFVLWSD